MIVLMRRSENWPHTVLRVAMDGENKTFIGQRYVQMLVDDKWRGKWLDRKWALPLEATSFQIIAHFFVPTIGLEPINQPLHASAAAALGKGKRGSEPSSEDGRASAGRKILGRSMSAKHTPSVVEKADGTLHINTDISKDGPGGTPSLGTILSLIHI